MNKINLKKIFLILNILNLNLNNILADTTPIVPTSFFLPRSTGANTARELVGWQKFIHQDNCNFYLTSDIAAEYQQTFKDQRIANALFGSDRLIFSGSQVSDRDICPCDLNTTTSGCQLLADYFGLPTNYSQSIKICPSIQNFILDFEFFMGLNNIRKGLYLRFHAPLTFSWWKLLGSNLNDCRNSLDQNIISQFAPGYMSQAASNTVENLADALIGKTFGDMKSPWVYGKFSQCGLHETKFADVDMILGYDFWQESTHHLGLYLQAVAPTGNLPTPNYIFSPVVGNGKHWELGLGISGHTTLWECGSDRSLLIWLEGNVTHLFSKNQKRSFDFTDNGTMSRYMLLKEFDASGNYIGLINAINFNTRDANVSIHVKGDFSVKLSYYHGNFGFDFGYNIYGNTQESICILNTPNNLDNRYFGIKGTQGVYAIQYNNVGGVLGAPTGIYPALSSTESDATAYSAGTVDNPVDVPGGAGTVATAWNSPATTGDLVSSAIIAQDSDLPVLVSIEDLNPCSAASPSILTNKIFLFLGHTWNGCRFSPQLGVGTEIEFNGKAKEQKYTDQWGIWIKGGVSF